MIKREYGGPAFPISYIVPTCIAEPGEIGEIKDSIVTCYGMSLRDYFASKATEDDVQFHMIHHFNNGRDLKLFPNVGTGVPNRTREQAKYQYADAMLKAREQ